MNVKESIRKLIFLPSIVIFLLFNFSVVSLVYVFRQGWDTHLVAIFLYVVAFYTLLVICVRIPGIVKRVKTALHENKYANTYLKDKDLRMRISMYRGLLISFVFATFKVILGFVYNSAWLFAMAGYNVILSLMRFVVVFRSQKKGLSVQEERRRGLQSYQVCGWLVMVLNVAVSVVMFMVIVQKQTIEYPMIVAIGLAAYTFYCFTMAVINMIKYRERKNPAYSAIKRIDMVKAIVSVFTLQVAMLTTFNGQGGMDVGLMNTITGLAVTVAINTIGAFMIAGGKKDLKTINYL